MTNLVRCPCGHKLSEHAIYGCEGANYRGDCSCDLSPWNALDAAVAAVRSPGPPVGIYEKWVPMSPTEMDRG